jgi:hypothetical protein
LRPYIVDKIRYCRGAKLAPSDRLGYYSHASPLSEILVQMLELATPAIPYNLNEQSG